MCLHASFCTTELGARCSIAAGALIPLLPLPPATPLAPAPPRMPPPTDLGSDFDASIEFSGGSASSGAQAAVPSAQGVHARGVGTTTAGAPPPIAGTPKDARGGVVAQAGASGSYSMDADQVGGGASYGISYGKEESDDEFSAEISYSLGTSGTGGAPGGTPASCARAAAARDAFSSVRAAAMHARALRWVSSGCP